MKILIDLLPIDKGGGLQVGIALLNYLKNNGTEHQFTLFIPNTIKGKLKHYDFKQELVFYFNKKKSILGFYKLKRKAQLLEKEICPDIVFCLFGPSYWRPKTLSVSGFAIPSLIYDIPKNFTLIVRIKYLLEKKLKSLFLNNSKYFIVETDVVKYRLSSRYKINSSNIYVIPNALNPLIQKQNEFKNIIFENREIKIFIPAAYYPHKNIEILIDVLHELNTNRFESNFIFVFPFSEESIKRTSFYKKAKKNNLLEYFKFLGELSLYDISLVYQSSQIVLLPTLLECYSAVYIESLFFEIPLITSNYDFATSICKDAAYYINPMDAKEIANAIIEITTNPLLKNKLIESSKIVFSDMISQEEKFKQLFGLLHSLYLNNS